MGGLCVGLCPGIPATWHQAWFKIVVPIISKENHYSIKLTIIRFRFPLSFLILTKLFAEDDSDGDMF